MSVLRRLPDSRFSEAQPVWSGRTVVVLGGGPSLTLAQVRLVEIEHKLERVKCVAVNDAYLLAPWADLHYAADSHWHAWHTQGIDKPVLELCAQQVREAWASFSGQKCTIENSGANVKDDAVHMLRNKNGVGAHGKGISLDPRLLVTGRSSGFQAMNLAVLAGAKRLLLLGFDAREGQLMSHWHGEHPRPTPSLAFEAFRRAFTEAQGDFVAAGVRVINCSPGTAITAFDRQRLEDALGIAKVAA